MQIYMYVHTRERDSRPGFDGVKIKLLLLLLTNNNKYYLYANILEDRDQWRDKTKGLSNLVIITMRESSTDGCSLDYPGSYIH